MSDRKLVLGGEICIQRTLLVGIVFSVLHYARPVIIAHGGLIEQGNHDHFRRTRRSLFYRGAKESRADEYKEE